MCVDLFYPYLLGGAENRYFELAKQLARMGDEVDILTMSLSRQSSYEELEGGRLRITRVGFKPQPLGKRSMPALLAYAFSSFLRSEPLGSCEFLDINWTGTLQGKLTAMRERLPCCVTFHDIFTRTPAGSGGFGLIASLFEKAATLIQRGGYFVAVSEATKLKLQRHFGLDADQIYVIPNGVNLADFSSPSKEKPSQRTGAKNLACISRLVAYKNVTHALTALKLLLSRGERVTLQIAGDGPEEANLRRLAGELGVAEHVSFLGFVSDRREVSKLISDADLLLNPSMFEGFGTVLLEGMAAGTPVVAYALDAYRDFAENRLNSLLVQPGRTDFLADAVHSVLCDEELASSLVRGGLETVKHFDWKEVARRARDCYSRIARAYPS